VSEIHDQLQAEGVVKEGRAMMIMGKRGIQGRLYVTADRLVFLTSSSMFGAFGAIGAVLSATVKPKKIKLEIPLAAISGVQRGKFGMNKNIVEVSHGDGDPARFAVRPYDEWAQAIQGAGASPAA
jgi:hypothetical protein